MGKAAIDLLDAINPAWPRWMYCAFLALARATPFVWLSPWLSVRWVPAPVRVALLVAIAVVLVPQGIPALQAVDIHAPSLFVMGVTREALYGLVLGLATAAPLYALEWTGRIGDGLRGSTAETEGPDGQALGSLGKLYSLAAGAIFLALGGHLKALEALTAGFGVLPATRHDTLLQSATVVTSALNLAVVAAVPFLFVSFIEQSATGLVGKLAPQLPAHFVAVPVRLLLITAAVALSFGVAEGQLMRHFHSIYASLGL